MYHHSPTAFFLVPRAGSRFLETTGSTISPQFTHLHE